MSSYTATQAGGSVGLADSPPPVHSRIVPVAESSHHDQSGQRLISLIRERSIVTHRRIPFAYTE